MTEVIKKTKSALIWNGVNQFGRFGFQAIINIVLARLLAPEDFGLVAMIFAITSFSDLFIDGGFRVGIVQKKGISDLELSTAFFLNLGIGLFFTILIYLAAPLISGLYDEPEIVSITQALSIVYVFKSVSIVHQGLMSREMDFKQRTISMLGARLFAGGVAILMAVRGFGVWSLVANSLLQSFLVSLLLWLQTDWKPKMMFNLSSLGELWGFSSRLLFMNILTTIGNKIDVFFIGKSFSPDVLGLYSKSKDIATLPASMGAQIVTTSFFPVFARLQDDNNAFVNYYRRINNVLLLLFAPLFAMMFVGGEELVLLVLGEKWGDSVPYFKLSTIIGLFIVFNGFLVYTVNSKGRSDLNLKKTLVNAPFRIVIFILLPMVFASFTPVYFLVVYIFSFLVEFVLTKYFIANLCKLRLKDNLLLGAEYIIVAVLAAFLIHLATFNNFELSPLARLLLKWSGFLTLFLLPLIVSKNQTLFWAFSKIKSKL